MRPGTVAESTFAPTSASVVSTPGQEFPGAYPNKQEAKPVGSEIAETVTGTANSFAQSVSETAQTYVPAAAEMIGQYLPKSVTDKMSEYIRTCNYLCHRRSLSLTVNLAGMTNPQGAVKASENDIVHDKSLPSTELTGAGAREHVGGVGALPGSLAESSVTKLPDERTGTAIPATVAGAAVAATEAAKGTAEKVQNTAYDAKDRVTHGGHTTAIGASSVPSRELDGAKPGDHSSGVGALPGSINEPGVARLPDEKGRGITGATSASVGTHSKTFGAATLPSQDDSTHGVSGGVGALPGLKDESGVALLPDERPSRETGTNFTQSTPSKVGETAHIAEIARQEGIRSSQTQAQQPITKQEKKEEGKAGAAAVGAAVGEKFAKDEHAKDSEKKVGSGIPNKVSEYFQVFICNISSVYRFRFHTHDGLVKDGHEEKQADLLHANLQPRQHVLATKGTRWGGKDLGGESYRRGEGIDLPEVHTLPSFFDDCETIERHC